ncbi:uncharacterized protein STEHIDRAFT_151390 [Stereum hirsutum FP-91666 SS1]|uniref:uncharacterized protein n=1 Tax=Stereum hirsutum (strain FP-91666) TaxID=721885 RepID=UPI000440F6AC|nr:uncharacterized protein STEHIDRAFT_151390 [Stereum hirsutum FP-91666 SS1]EIM92042.1 hypothetical protein STEHIDRAFT_151390 [Stereum hirsutum FP-91666 SS1]
MSSASFYTALNKISRDLFDLRRDSIRLQGVEEEVQQHLKMAESELRLITKWIKEFDSPDLTSKLEETEHQRAILALKAEEYQAELRHIQDIKPTTTVADFLAQKERLRKKEHEVKIKRARIQAFQGLPPNLALAKQELHQAREELIRLSNLRERLLNNMVEEIS